jgi:hypothetical protein
VISSLHATEYNATLQRTEPHFYSDEGGGGGGGVAADGPGRPDPLVEMGPVKRDGFVDRWLLILGYVMGFQVRHCALLGSVFEVLKLQPGMGNCRCCQSFTHSSFGCRRLVRCPAVADWGCVSSLFLINTYENSRSFFAVPSIEVNRYSLSTTSTHQILKLLVIASYSHSVRRQSVLTTYPRIHIVHDCTYHTISFACSFFSPCTTQTPYYHQLRYNA